MKTKAAKKNQKPVRKIIAICGRISSGKTTLANQISERCNLPIASFGAFIKHYCQVNNLPTDRKNLQDVGRTFISKNPKKFLKDVIMHYKGNSEIVVLEGVRHRVIIKHLATLCEESLVIFVDADPKTIYQRYADRGRESDSEMEYDKYDLHPVEFEVDQLKLLSDFILVSDRQQEEKLFSTVDAFVN